MSYTALYRKWRPDRFSDVKGQEHIITTLKNQIQANRVGHAYLFCGTRGTGKTTVAKIFAKAVNCEHPEDGSPCGTCSLCRAIQSGNSFNVIEIDAASNNGVENIREIREEVAYSPTEGNYKVYIIDEVHMLSTGAFNALLKTLEEPPSYVIFILATTEAHKIPITILSRCQRYDFRRMTIETIAGRLKELMDSEQVGADDWALSFIAKKADGSMRDALSLTDQCIAFYLGQELTYDRVLEVLGAVDTEVFHRFFQTIKAADIRGLMVLLEELVMQGRELNQFILDFTWYLRNLLLMKSSEDMEELLDVSTEHLSRLKEAAAEVSEETLIRDIRIFSELSNQIKYAAQKRILIEIALIKLCRPQMEQNMDSVLSRLESLEEKIEHGLSTAALPQEAVQAAEPEAAKQWKPEPEPEPLKKALPEDIQYIVKNWKGLIQKATGPVKQYLGSARLSLGSGERLQIVLSSLLAYEFLNSEEHRADIQAMLKEKIGREVELELVCLEHAGVTEQAYPDLEKLIKTDIIIEEE